MQLPEPQAEPLEPTAEPQGEPEPQEEYVPLRFRGEEKAVPKRLIDELAQSLGSDAATGAMRIQQSWDASRVYEETKQKEREWQRYLREQEREHEERLQQLESQWQAKLSQYQQGPQKPDPDDPIELLKLSLSEQRRVMERIASIETRQDEERKHFAAMIEEQRQVEDGQRISGAYDGAKKEWAEKHPGVRLPSEEEIEGYLLDTGLAHNRRVPWERAFRIALRDLTYDQLPEISSAAALNRLRNPQAKIVTPGSSGPKAPAQPKPSDAESLVGEMSISDMREFAPPERR